MNHPNARCSGALIALLLGAILLGGCGQKGPLYLPQSQQPKSQQLKLQQSKLQQPKPQQKPVKSPATPAAQTDSALSKESPAELSSE
jgi:predicted small lipoprotein YifL